MIRFMILGLLVVCSWSSSVYAEEEGVISLDATVTGNQEQPKVLYILPWQGPRGTDALQQNIDSQLKGAFAHIDRSEWKRQLQYHDKLNAEGKQTTVE